MATNFDYLKRDPKFREFAPACVEAEQSYSPTTTTVTAIATRRALEITVKWIYKVEEELTIPYRDNLMALIHEHSFKELIDQKLFPRILYIIKLGNAAAHTNKRIGETQAKESLKALFDFMSWVDYSYSPVTNNVPFDESLLKSGGVSKGEIDKFEQESKRLQAEKVAFETERATFLAEKSRLEAERKTRAERQVYTAQRKEKASTEEFNCDIISEFETRKLYIDLDLELAGWSHGTDSLFEVEVTPMPNPSNKGFADYVLYDENGKPLAVVEAKKTSVDPRNGKIQAKLYADALEEMYGVRPFVFYANGFETHFWDDKDGVPRQVSGFFSKEELQWLFFQKKNRQPLDDIYPDPDIAGRPYQIEAITRTCEAYAKGERKALLVMATGSGKTRTAVSLVDVLQKQGWVKNALFLADRRELVKQAKVSFKELLPNLTMCNLLDKGDGQTTDRMIFSTYPTMMNAIDSNKLADGGRLFSPAHFDLIIIDEAHRSIYKKYQDLFTYFDGMLFGLTATPHDEIDRNTYGLFERNSEDPTFAYELEQAVTEGFLVPYTTIETTLKFVDEGIRYDELSEADKEHWEETFDDDDEFDEIPSSELNKFLFNASTVDLVLQQLMDNGQKIEGGDKIGKTIVFAQNQKHANFILERFCAIYPEYAKNSFAEVITNSVKYSEKLIESFKISKTNPQIAISVDMLDTGVDVPEVLNLVFFKKVRSKAKFWQMIGRGTRLCPDVFGIGKHKEKFVIFDFCRNFEYFRVNKNGVEGKHGTTLSEKLFNVRVRIARELQHADYQSSELTAHRTKLVAELLTEVRSIDRNRFQSKLRIEYIDRYNKKSAWDNITDEMVYELSCNLALLVPPQQYEELAKRFDYLMYTIELADLQKVSAPMPKAKVVSTAQALQSKGNIAAVKEKADLIEAILTDEHWENADLFVHEEVRLALRDLLILLETESKVIYYTDFKDEVMSVREEAGHFSVNNLKNYRDRVNSYLKEHRDDTSVYKLRNNRELTGDDILHLEEILWHDLGTEEEYHKEYGDEPLVKLVAKLVGLTRVAANAFFAEFLQDKSLNSSQIDFVNLVVNHIVENGGLFDNNILKDHPFSKHGSIIELFDGKVDVVKHMMEKIKQLNDRLAVG